MPTYAYRCPNGHKFDQFVLKISDAKRTAICPECGEVAERLVSGGAGLVFKGSGFYITDYGKDGKKDQAVSPPSGTTASGKESAKDGAKDSGKESSKGDRSSEGRSGESRSGESQSGGEGAGGSAKAEPSAPSPTESSASKAAGNAAPAGGSKQGPAKSE